MCEQIVIGGSGGQGVLFIGRLLAETAFMDGYEVVWIPSYGAEKRGGTVWCNVTISNEKIGDLFVTKPTIAIAMNLAAFVIVEPNVKPGGRLVVNQSLISLQSNRDDLHVIYVPAIDLAAELDNNSASNLIILGALLADCPVVSMSNLIAILESMLPNDQKRLEMNKRALNHGYTRSVTCR